MSPCEWCVVNTVKGTDVLKWHTDMFKVLEVGETKIFGFSSSYDFEIYFYNRIRALTKYLKGETTILNQKWHNKKINKINGIKNGKYNIFKLKGLKKQQRQVLIIKLRN